MNTSQQKREILSIVSSIEDSLEQIENIVEDIEDTELYETTLHWIDRAFSIIENGVQDTIVQINNLD